MTAAAFFAGIVRPQRLAVLILVLGAGGCAGGLADSLQQAGGAQGADGEPAIEKLMEAGPLGEKTMGRADAPVTLVEYASLTCPYCRAFHDQTFPRFKKDYIDTGKVYFIYREFPIGRPAAAAALAARCAPQADYFRLNWKFLATQRQWTAQEVRHDAIYKIVQDSGMSRAEFDSCLANQNINDGLVWVKQRGRELGVVGTPTFFINGRKVGKALTYEEMRDMIEPHLADQGPPA